MSMSSLFEAFDNIIVLDLETTGIDPRREEVIELAALRAGGRESGMAEEESFDLLLRLSPGRRLPPFITGLTGISEEDLAGGVSKREACERLCAMLERPAPIIAAYNAQFDLCFLYYLLRQFGMEGALKRARLLDVLTVYKDRRPYPHKLSDAVCAYSLSSQNTHRAIDDARAALELLEAMERERDDLERYVNLFGYNPKYGVSGPRIASVRYAPQPYDAGARLYET